MSSGHIMQSSLSRSNTNTVHGEEYAKSSVIGSSAEEKFAKRLAGRRTSEKMEVHESVPAWLASHVNASQDASGNETSTVDILGEFLADEDMLNLEVICMKWRGLDDSDLEAISKISPDIVKNLVQGEKDVREYCSYRRQCASKHHRKVAVQSSMHRKTLINDGADSEDEDDAEDEKMDEKRPAPRGRKTVSVEDDEKQKDTPKSMAQRKKSIMASDRRRMSVRPEKQDLNKLARAGSSIIGQDDAKLADAASERRRKQSMFAAARAPPLKDAGFSSNGMNSVASNDSNTLSPLSEVGTHL